MGYGRELIPMIIDKLDNIVSWDRLRKFSNRIIVKIIMIQQIYGISYRSSGNFFKNHKEIMNLVGIDQT